MDVDGLNSEQKDRLAELVEMCLIENAQRLLDNNGMKVGDFLGKAWPQSNKSVAKNRWWAMRGKDPKTGKPAKCSVGDAYRIAQALGLKVGYLMIQAEALAEERLEEEMRTAPQAAPELETPGKKGKKAAAT